jgi:hypothetical protein
MSKSPRPKSLGSLNFGTFTYKVYLHPGELRAPDGDPVRGYCDNCDRTIHLSGALPDDQLEETFLHEVFHAVSFAFRLHLSYDGEEALAGPVGLGLALGLRPWIRGRLRKGWK